MDKAWKAFERRLARRVGGRRIPVTGERDGADVVVGGPFVYQAKPARAYLPTYGTGCAGSWRRASATAALQAWWCGKLRTHATMTLWCSYGSGIGKTGMARRILKLKSPPEMNPTGLNLVHGESPGNGANEHLEHTTASRPLRNRVLSNTR